MQTHTGELVDQIMASNVLLLQEQISFEFESISLRILIWFERSFIWTKVGIYERKILRKDERKHAFDQEKSKIQEKKIRKEELDQDLD